MGEGLRQRAVGVQLVVRHHHGESGGHAEVGEETDEQRGHDADGDGAHGVFSFLAWEQGRAIKYGRQLNSVMWFKHRRPGMMEKNITPRPGSGI